MTAPAVLDIDAIVKVLTTPGVQDTEITAPADEAKIRERLAFYVDPDATSFGIPFGGTLYVSMNEVGLRALADAGVAIDAYESEDVSADDLLSGKGNFFGNIYLTSEPAFSVTLAQAVEGSPLFDVLGSCDAMDKQVGRNGDGVMSVTAAFDY